MLSFSPLTLGDKALFDSYVAGHGYMQAEASFANLFMWQPVWDIRIAEEGNALYVSFDNPVYRPFLLPPFLKDESVSIEPYMRRAEEYMRRRYGEFYIKCATARQIDKIRADCGTRYRFRYDEDDSQYVYNTQDLIDLAGKKYHGKRNHINAFLRDNEPVVEQYAPLYRDDCLALQEAWALARGGPSRETENEYLSIQRTLDNYEALGVRGIVVLLEGVVSAFTFGEQLNPEMALIHIEKARVDVNGLFPYINQQFLIRDWSESRYVNREEDMGVPGIRQAKRSYHPVFLVDEFDVIRREGH